MPIYVYRCENCGEKLERLQGFSDPAPDVCPHCGKQNGMHKQVTAPAFRLVGSGWYETDFKSASEHRHNLAGEGDKPKATSHKAADSKPAAKPAAAKTGS